MRKLRLAGVAGLAIAAFVVPTAPAQAETFIVECPDHYFPVPAQAAPPAQNDRNHNGNLFVCAKGPQGSNGHFNVTDDKGETVPPTEWDVDAVVPIGMYMVNYALDQTGTYGLSPAPDDVTDDLGF